MNAWNAQLGRDLRTAVELAAGRRCGARRDHHGRRPRVLLRRRPAGGLRSHAGRPSRRRHGPARALSPDHHGGQRRCPSPCSRRSTGRRPASAARSRSRATWSSPASPPTCCSPSSTSASCPTAAPPCFVPARAGMARAAEMAMLGERIPARRAMEWGLVNRVTADDGFDGGGRRPRRAPGHRAHALLRGHQAGSSTPGCYAAHGRAARAGGRRAAGAAASGDFAEGVRAFTEKRDARFAGE